jgi:hypothetical protein
MIRFERGKSYLYLFPVVMLLVLSSFAAAAGLGYPDWGFLVMPAFIAYLLASEIESGVALDSFWRAKYARGGDEYRLIILWHCVALVLFLAMSVFALGPW